MTNNTIKAFKKAISNKGYAWFDSNKDYNLNIIGVRDNSRENLNEFGDYLYCIYRDESKN